jgi:AcrR family transcriptional regulator
VGLSLYSCTASSNTISTGGVLAVTTSGRPRSSSRATIEDAAAELFLEQGFAATTIDQVTRRAGVSRATFFNYFAQKSDLLWLEVDEAIAALAESTAACARVDEVRAAVVATARLMDGRAVPLAVSQAELLGSTDEIAASGMVRLAALARAFSGLGDRTTAFVLAGLIGAAWLDWARAGVARGALAERLEAAFDRVSIR